ncbi:MFS transporter [Amycolatopsis sp. lyj-23]|uniref:MFS transporter n=1 Tax=Amycolatopsis sp. lyj-23 TaxID=2789283 RepID=UPI00397D14A7
MTTTLSRASKRTMVMTLVVVLLADALDLIDATIANVAAPSLAANLGAGPALITWLGASYALALGSLLVLGGRIGDRFGQRRTFLAGLTGFVLASAAAGLAAGPGMLVGARVAQGAFGALLIPQGMAIITSTFPKKALRKAFGLFGPMLGVFAVAGPLLGGVLIDADLFGLAWRPVFLINIVVGGVALALAFQFLPTVEADRTTRIDLVASGLLAGSLFGFLFGLITGAEHGWGALALSTTAAGVVLFAVFCRRQARSDQPLLARSLLRNRGFTSGLVMGLLVFAVFSGLMYVISLFFQIGLGYSPTMTSLNLIPLTAGIMGGSGISTALVARLGRKLVAGGLLATLAGTGLLLLVVNVVAAEATWWHNAVATVVVGVGAGICFSTIFTFALGDVEPHEAGAASGSLSAVQQVANGIGSATVTSVFLTVSTSGGTTTAMTTTLLVVGGVVLACLAAVPLLPRTAALEN